MNDGNLFDPYEDDSIETTVLEHSEVFRECDIKEKHVAWWKKHWGWGQGFTCKPPDGDVEERVRANNYRATDRGRRGDLTVAQWAALRRAFKRLCAYCGRHNNRIVIEHVVSISRGGATGITNVLPACPRCNVSKRSKSLREWQKDPLWWSVFEWRLKEARTTMPEIPEYWMERVT